MKKNFLILSAMLTVVVGAALLQSCSSESVYEEPAYGHYTEEEINVIKAMAEAYGLSIELNEDYYGPKKTLYEFENDMIGLSAMLGEYEIIPTPNARGKVVCTSRKKEQGSRTLTRHVEGSGSWTGEEIASVSKYKASVTIEWTVSQEYSKASGSVTGYVEDGTNNYEEIGTGGLSCIFSGSNGIDFNGSFRAYVDKDEKSAISYYFNVCNGDLNTESKVGSFTVTANEKEVAKDSND